MILKQLNRVALAAAAVLAAAQGATPIFSTTLCPTFPVWQTKPTPNW